MTGSLRARRATEFSMMECDSLNMLLDIAKAASAEIDLEKLLQLIADRTRYAVKAERCSVFLHDNVRNELWTIVAHGMEKTQIRIDADSGLAGYVMRTGCTLNIRDAYAARTFNRNIDYESGYRTRSVLAVPLKNRQGKTVGVFEALNKKHGRFNKDDESLMESVAAIAAIAVQNAMLYQELTSRMLSSQIRLMAEEAER